MSGGRGSKHRVIAVKELGDNVFVLRLERNGLVFEPGRYLTLGTCESATVREYSIFSSPRANWLDFLIKDVGGDGISSQLHRMEKDDIVLTDGPFGEFMISADRHPEPLLFVATGTGIAPFHCFAGAYPMSRYTVLHGVRRVEHLYGRGAFEANSHIACLTDPAPGETSGRVTSYLKQHPQDPSTSCYLCGNSDMIFEAFEILQGQGIPRDRLFAEIYF